MERSGEVCPEEELGGHIIVAFRYLKGSYVEEVLDWFF